MHGYSIDDVKRFKPGELSTHLAMDGQEFSRDCKACWSGLESINVCESLSLIWRDAKMLYLRL